MRDGIVFGAAVGFGFAALETAGYAFNAMFTMQGLSLESLVQTEILRGVLTPVGYGSWTAIVGGALFAAAASRGRLRPDRRGARLVRARRAAARAVGRVQGHRGLADAAAD